MADDRHTPWVDVWQPPQESEACESVVHLPSLEQIYLQGVPGTLPVRDECLVHRVDGAFSLIGGWADAAPEQKTHTYP